MPPKKDDKKGKKETQVMREIDLAQYLRKVCSLKGDNMFILRVDFYVSRSLLRCQRFPPMILYITSHTLGKW